MAFSMLNKWKDSPMGQRFSNWGWRGAGKAAGRSAAAAFGFYEAPGGGMRWLGGAPTWKTAKGLGLGAAIGGAVYGATGNELLGIGAGVGTTLGAGALGGGMKLLGPAFAGMVMYQGYQREGVWGAAKAGVGTVAEFAAFDVAIGAVKTAFSGTAISGTVASLGKFALHPATLIAAGIGYGAYRGVRALANLGREAERTEFTGDMQAFSTRAAYTMRQRALQEINRSHTNARTILGNEATLQHL